jgi:aminoglycoside phosphotransferase (APT) family kinase protein
VPFPRELIEAIASRHGLDGEIELLRKGGMVNEAWRIGEFVLRICREEEGKDEAAREAAVVPLVIESGIRAPKLVAFELDSNLTPMPYTIYERASGVLLGYCDFEPERLDEVYREIGREIARLGRMDVSEAVRPLLRDGRALEPWRTLAKAMSHGVLSCEEGKEIGQWTESLEPQLGEASAQGLIHMDIHPWNVFVDPDADALTAIIDWGDASWGDPAVEFASMPMQCVPAMLEGYRQENGVADEAFVARAVHAGLSLSLWEIRELPDLDFDRRWWRMPPDGWAGVKRLIATHWPQLAGGWA